LSFLFTSVEALSFNNPNIPALEPCASVPFSWTGGEPEFDLKIIDVNSNAVIEDFPGITDTSFTWVADSLVTQKV
ncbi:hypothetical protein BD309DRAFT_817702, partial [Dichomitus squalens]